MSDTNDLILNTLQQLHSDLSDFRTETSQNFLDLKPRVSAVEAQIHPFFETDGGREKMQDQIDSLNKARWYGVGVIAGLTTIGHYILHKLGI